MKQWASARAAGEDLAIDELCRDFPECRSLIEEKIDLIQSLDGMMEDFLSDDQSRSAYDDFAPEVVVSGCRLIRKLGEGGLSVVFLADHPQTRVIALKISRTRSYEARILANLDHPSIVKVYHCEHDDDANLSFVHMEYFPGISLQEVIDQILIDVRSVPLFFEVLRESIERISITKRSAFEDNNSLPGVDKWYQLVAALGARIADAIDHAHNEEVLHRDIKPANILVDSNGNPKLIDFNTGFDKRIEGLSADQQFGVTLKYMSPEQHAVMVGDAAHETVNRATDVYSLCYTLAELLGLKATDMQLDNHNALVPLPNGESAPIELLERIQSGLNVSPNRRPRAKDLSKSLSIFSDEEVSRLIYPVRPSWARRFRLPGRLFYTGWAMLKGIAPNFLIAGLFILYARLFFEPQPGWAKPFVYFQEILFTLLVPLIGASTVAIYYWPSINLIGLRTTLVGALDRGFNRAFRGSAFCAITVLVCWILVGILFPIMNVIVGGGTLDRGVRLQFFFIALWMGISSALVTMVLVTYFSMKSLIPALLAKHPRQLLDDKFSRQKALLERSSLYYCFNSFLGTSIYLLIRSSSLETRDAVFLVAMMLVSVVNIYAIEFVVPRIKRLRKVIGRVSLPIGNQ